MGFQRSGRVRIGSRPSRARNRTLSFMALGVAPVLLAGGFLVGTHTSSEPGAAERADVELSVSTPVTLIGHGHGHGRGMGQYGAYGYAKRGWSANKILSHYYGGTTAGKVGRPEITVALGDKNSVNVRADAGMRVGGQTVAPGQAVSLSGGTATITNGCGGGVVRSVPATLVEPLHMTPNRPAGEFLRFCGSNEAYRGALGYEGGRVINKLHVDDYVKGVIPRESVPAWGDSGGMEALKAQAVAARTYALAAIERGKKIDNTQNSQVYGGVSGEDPRTNAAADATAGQIRLAGGRPAFTEFSASTGGFTAGGEFPAVIDEGDTTSPNHDWTATVSPGSIGSAFGVGALRSFEVIEANGLGAENGRALKVRVSGTGGTVEATGEEARTKLGLKSSWFSVQGQANKPKIVSPPQGPGSGGVTGLEDLAGFLDQLLPGASELLGLATSAMNGKFDDLGGITGPLGQALGLPALTPDAAGVTQLFEHGVMFFSTQTGAHVLTGDALAQFDADGGLAEQGFPTEDAIG